MKAKSVYRGKFRVSVSEQFSFKTENILQFNKVRRKRIANINILMLLFVLKTRSRSHQTKYIVYERYACNFTQQENEI